MLKFISDLYYVWKLKYKWYIVNCFWLVWVRVEDILIILVILLILKYRDFGILLIML